MRIICLDWPLERNAITVGKLNVIILGDFFFKFLSYFFFKSFCAANIKKKNQSIKCVGCGLAAPFSSIFHVMASGRMSEQLLSACPHVHGYFLKIHVLQCNLTLLSCVAGHV